MKRICAWHPQNFGFTLVIEDGTGHETHGICPDCKTIEVAKLGTFRLEQFGEPYLPYQPRQAEAQQRRDLASGRTETKAFKPGELPDPIVNRQGPPKHVFRR